MPISSSNKASFKDRVFLLQGFPSTQTILTLIPTPQELRVMVYTCDPSSQEDQRLNYILSSVTAGILEILFFFFFFYWHKVKNTTHLIPEALYDCLLRFVCIWVYGPPSAGQPCMVHVLFFIFYICKASHWEMKFLKSSHFIMNIWSYY